MNLAKYFNQTAVYWGSPENDGFGGYSFADPIEVKVRWTVKQERFLSSQGSGNGVEELLSRVTVLAETDFEMLGKMSLTILNDLSSSQLPETENALTIMGFEKIPTKDARQFLRKVYLV
jgi:hypothetical protein